MKYLIWLSHDTSSLDEIYNGLAGQGHEVGILLVQDGVFMLDKGCPFSDEMQEFSASVFALKEHIDERGIGARLAVEAKQIEYDELVDLLMEKYDKIITA
ncbi:MAG: sulfurtransferase complex subunit TusB [Candidatus Thorarchaeota archaeon]|jgi:sulfur relay protein TusB/DsrH